MTSDETIGAEVQAGLDAFVHACREVLADQLVAVVLFGSAAEGQLRPRSDINALVVLERFEAARMVSLRKAYAEAQAGLHLQAMFVERRELQAAADAFAVKFADILVRRKVLFGPDVLAELAVSREAMLARARQVLLNLELRLRERFVALELTEPELARLLGEAAPALRACALTIRQMQGAAAGSPSESLWQMVRTAGRKEWEGLLAAIAEARQRGRLPTGALPQLLREMLAITEWLRGQLDALGGAAGAKMGVTP
jgi:predicted nucleotidyltransferase